MDNSKCCTSHIRLFAHTHPHTDDRGCRAMVLNCSSAVSKEPNEISILLCSDIYTYIHKDTSMRSQSRRSNHQPSCPNLPHEGRQFSRTTASKVENVNAQMCSGNKRMVNYSPVISQSNHITVTNWNKYENVYPYHGHMASNPHTLWAPSLPFTTASLSKGNKMTEEELNAHSL